jgi:hypothetical protein
VAEFDDDRRIGQYGGIEKTDKRNCGEQKAAFHEVSGGSGVIGISWSLYQP